MVAQLQTGITATASGMTVTTVASPAFPRYDFLSTSGNHLNGWNELNLESCTVGNGSNSCSDQYALSSINPEGAIGLHVGGGPGPLMVVNNYIRGSGITGPFMSDDLTNGASPCGTSYPCPA